MVMGPHLFTPIERLIMTTVGMQASWYSQFAVTTLVLAGPGFRFFRRGLPALFRGAPDMNSLVAVSTAAAYGYSLVATFAPRCCRPARSMSITRPPPSSRR
jgi:cation transport ATPase